MTTIQRVTFIILCAALAVSAQQTEPINDFNSFVFNMMVKTYHTIPELKLGNASSTTCVVKVANHINRNVSCFVWKKKFDSKKISKQYGSYSCLLLETEEEFAPIDAAGARLALWLVQVMYEGHYYAASQDVGLFCGGPK